MISIKEQIRVLRNEFTAGSLDESHVSKSPVRQFQKWMEQAIESKVMEPNAMTLATAAKNLVDARIVLLRDFGANGFTFFTNYKSIKGREIRLNKNVCLNFFWPELQRQVRIHGKIEKLPAKNSDSYFASRPRESQIAAWASHQSEKLNSRNDLDKRYTEYVNEFREKKVPRPPHWGGYRVKPVYFEFWQGRRSRLHDRIIYEGTKNGWRIGRLNP
jgi:pyridoxamine 5'-phosphate oxidase